jgi:hypothetical protein
MVLENRKELINFDATLVRVMLAHQADATLSPQDEVRDHGPNPV